jgi:hypothetical protein
VALTEIERLLVARRERHDLQPAGDGEFGALDRQRLIADDHAPPRSAGREFE